MRSTEFIRASDKSSAVCPNPASNHELSYCVSGECVAGGGAVLGRDAGIMNSAIVLVANAWLGETSES